ncbi:transposase [Nevskia sp.]|uniref:transposase n=1 Tax=Nevskia sp. TaxID=1929292 RepID=UPI0025D7C93B|nr:transposase [Nevskia sp.]
MARLPRIVIPGLPHQVTRRGNHREQIFLNDDDYALYRDLLAEACKLQGVEVWSWSWSWSWSWCLMPNHLHLILVPNAKDGRGYALGEAHRRYSGFINARNRQTGHLFQGRFGSVAMNEPHPLAAARYVALNPVKARLVRKAADWPSSSARAHLSGVDDELVKVKPLLDRITNFTEFLDSTGPPLASAALERGLSVGRPLMDAEALKHLEVELGRSILPAKRGRTQRVLPDGAQCELGDE